MKAFESFMRVNSLQLETLISDTNNGVVKWVHLENSDKKTYYGYYDGKQKDNTMSYKLMLTGSTSARLSVSRQGMLHSYIALATNNTKSGDELSARLAELAQLVEKNHRECPMENADDCE